MEIPVFGLMAAFVRLETEACLGLPTPRGRGAVNGQDPAIRAGIRTSRGPQEMTRTFSSICKGITQNSWPVHLVEVGKTSSHVIPKRHPFCEGVRSLTIN